MIPPPLEVKIVKSIIESRFFKLTIELHEDYESNGYYIFQKSNNPYGIDLGYKIIEVVKDIMPINLNKIIDDNEAEKGLIHKTKPINLMEWWPMAGYSLAMKTDHSFTFETHTRLPMEVRVKGTYKCNS